MKRSHVDLGASNHSIERRTIHCGSSCGEQGRLANSVVVGHNQPKQTPTTVMEVSPSNEDLMASTIVTSGRCNYEPVCIRNLLDLEVGGKNVQSIEVCPQETSLENALNSESYGVELEVGRSGPSLASKNLSKEVVEHLLSLLPSYERDEFVRTHAVGPSVSPPPRFEGEVHETEILDLELNDPFPTLYHDIHTSLYPTESILPCSKSTDFQHNRVISEEDFKRKVLELAREEEKYRKKKAKKAKKKLKQKAKIVEVEKDVRVTSPTTHGLPLLLGMKSTLKPVLAPAKLLSNDWNASLGPRTNHLPNLSPCSGTSSINPAFTLCQKVVGEQDVVEDLSNWGIVEGIPPLEVNSLAEPIGEFWHHMRCHAFEQSPFEFLWHLDWNKQCPKLKARFVLKLRKIYPGPWDHKILLKAVGANLRERRTRLKRKFEKSKNPKQVSKPAGCSKASWTIIYESTKDEKKQRKAQLCKQIAEKRVKVQGCTHRCGSRGIRGLHDHFVDHFKQNPTDEELEYGKSNGWLALAEKKTASKKLLDRCKDEEIMLGSNNPRSTPTDGACLNLTKPSSRLDSRDSTSSSESNNDNDTSTSY